MQYKGFDIEESERHGKASVGKKKFSSIQIRYDIGHGYLCLKTISFPVRSPQKKEEAIAKAKQLIDEGKIKPIKA